jgi:predicted nucleic acid-binding Zn ribbon protein
MARVSVYECDNCSERMDEVQGTMTLGGHAASVAGVRTDLIDGRGQVTMQLCSRCSTDIARGISEVLLAGVEKRTKA